MGYCTNSEVLQLLQTQNAAATPPTVSFTASQISEENGYKVDTSTVTVTATQVLSENNYTTPTATVTEYLLDNAINFVNLQANTVIPELSGTAGTKSSVMTRTQAVVAKQLTALLIKAYKDRGPNIGFAGISVNSIINDPQYALFSENIKQSILRLRTLTLESMERLMDNAISHINNLATANIPLMVPGETLDGFELSDGGTHGFEEGFERDAYKIAYMTSIEAAAVKPFISVILRSSMQLTPDPQLEIAYKDATAKLSWNYMRGDYTALIEQAIILAGHVVDDYCSRPEDYFVVGGARITEVLNGKDVVYYYSGSGIRWVSYPNIYTVLRFNQRPVLQALELYEYANGTWVYRGARLGFEYGFEDGFEYADTNYLETIEEGAHLLTLPARTFNNVRVTYLSGYVETPSAVRDVTMLLATQIVQGVVSNMMLAPTKPLALPNPTLTEDMKERLGNYVSIVLPKSF